MVKDLPGILEELISRINRMRISSDAGPYFSRARCGRGIDLSMKSIILNAQFQLLSATNLCLFLIMATWTYLPLYIVEIGGDVADAGIVMGSLGVTSLGSIPLLTPLMDKYGRKIFIVAGVFLAGVSNVGFLLFDAYSPLMILVRLLQGVAFAACFNGCSTGVVDLIPPEHRAQGIGIFGVSGSLAVAVGPYLGETVLLAWGFPAFFLLLTGFGLLGFGLALMVKEPSRKAGHEGLRDFFPTAFRDRHYIMMIVAAIFGSAFAAMNTFFPLYAKSIGLRAGVFFTCYGVSLVVVRVLLGEIADRVSRKRLIFACLLGFGSMLILTSMISTVWHMVILGVLFGLLQGLSYPAMMAQMVDRSRETNRAAVVGLFTGSFGAGINVSMLVWGYVAELTGLAAMYMVGGILVYLAAAISIYMIWGTAAAKRSPA
ncbi:MAG: MFS transporter [Deltaproteobacteria bacterium]|nr:MFS transporter [Deltaproteobacteria bacterium]